MHVLSARMAHAEQTGNKDQVAALQRIEAFIVSLAQTDVPPELDLLNELVTAATVEERAQIMAANSDMMSDDLVGLVQALRGQAESANQQDLAQRLAQIGLELEAGLPEGN
jgi:hypothetical protein